MNAALTCGLGPVHGKRRFLSGDNAKPWLVFALRKSGRVCSFPSAEGREERTRLNSRFTHLVLRIRPDRKRNSSDRSESSSPIEMLQFLEMACPQSWTKRCRILTQSSTTLSVRPSAEVENNARELRSNISLIGLLPSAGRKLEKGFSPRTLTKLLRRKHGTRSKPAVQMAAK